MWIVFEYSVIRHSFQLSKTMIDAENEKSETPLHFATKAGNEQ